MWTIFAKNFRLLVSLLALLSALPAARACGVYYYGEEYRVALLNPYLIGEEWSAFFYSAQYINHTRPFKTGSDRQQNCREWADYMGNGVTSAEVQAVVYQANFDDLLNAITEGADNQRFAGNAFFKALLQKEKKPVLDYLLLAKEYEHYSFMETTDPWGDRYEQMEGAELKAKEGKQVVQQKMIAGFEREKDTFLRRRYAYQLLVMSMYAGDKGKFNRLYQEFFKNGTTSPVLANWAHFHRAAMTEDSVEANYLYAMSFARCPEKRIACYQRFDKSLADKTLAFCKNDQERAIVLAFAAARNPGRTLAQIKKIQALDPNCIILPLLLVREISKLEDWLLTDKLTRMSPAAYPGANDEAKWEWSAAQWEQYRKANKISDKAYLAEVRDFMVKLSGQPSKPLSPDLMRLFAGHLYIIENKTASAKSYLSTISAKAATGIRDQQLTEQILILLEGRNLADKSTKNELVALLLKLQAVRQNYPDSDRDFAALNLLISDVYEKKADLVNAYFFYNHALGLPTDADLTNFGTPYYDLIRYLDWRASEKDVDAVLAILEKNNKTPFEQYLTNAPLPSRNALLDLRGTISFRKNNLPEALSAFKQVQQDFWQNKYEFSNHLVSDPFVVWTDSLHRGKFPATKTAFIQRLIDLETEAKNNPAKAAASYLALGTAWLNCTWQGKSWMMFSYGKSIHENRQERAWGTYSFQPLEKSIQEVYYEGSRALSYLAKAKSASKDPEVQAQADYLMARFRSGTSVITPEEEKSMEGKSWKEWQQFRLKKEMSFYDQWTKDWKATAYYDEVKGICPVLGTYWGK